MKLNNNGFAITVVLYGLLILFSFLVSSYLLVLSAKKDRVNVLIDEIENDYKETETSCPSLSENISFPYKIEYTGTYVFSITSLSSSTFDNCSIELEAGFSVDFRDNTIYLDNMLTEAYIIFNDYDCYDTVWNKDVVSINSIDYLCE